MSGHLIALEGIDGAGKTTHREMLAAWLRSQDVRCLVSEWNSSPVVSPITRRAKQATAIGRDSYAAIHAADFSERYTSRILPALESGMTVIADRYIYTAFARDLARGADPAWSRSLYDYARAPNLAVYFRVDLDVALTRNEDGRRGGLKPYDYAGDLRVVTDERKAFIEYQGRVQRAYEDLVTEGKMRVIESNTDVDDAQRTLRQLVGKIIWGWQDGR